MATLTSNVTVSHTLSHPGHKLKEHKFEVLRIEYFHFVLFCFIAFQKETWCFFTSLQLAAFDGF